MSPRLIGLAIQFESLSAASVVACQNICYMDSVCQLHAITVSIWHGQMLGGSVSIDIFLFTEFQIQCHMDREHSLPVSTVGVVSLRFHKYKLGELFIPLAYLSQLELQRCCYVMEHRERWTPPYTNINEYSQAIGRIVDQ